MYYVHLLLSYRLTPVLRTASRPTLRYSSRLWSDNDTHKMSVKGLHLSCSRYKDNRCFGLHISGLCTLPYLLRLLKQPRCQCCYGYIASKSDLSALNLYTVIQTFSTVGRRFKGILLQRVVNRQSLVQRRELSSGTPFRCLPSRYQPALPRLELHLLKYEYTGLTEMGRSLFRAVCSLQ